MAELKLHGFWASPFSHRVIWALKLKGIDYEYIEEDLSNKSELLLEYNPVYKKIPVLVHGDKPIAESVVILEYIEETWPEINPLLPEDPYERAMARFWIQYGETKGSAALTTLFGASKEDDQQKAVLDVLKTLEDQCLGDKKFFGGDNINLVDISFGLFAWWLPIIEEMVGVKMVEPSTLPRLHAWAENFTQLPVIKENLVDHDKLLAHVRCAREKVATN